MIDITNPGSPQLVGGVDAPDEALGVVVSGAHVYVSDGSAGLQVLPAQCELPSSAGDDDGVAPAMSLRVLPNPGSCQTLIRFETRTGGLVQTTIYDLAGRRIRGVFDGILDGGAHDFTWDGRDEYCRSVAAGIYLVRISTVDGTTTGRFVIVR